MFGEYSVPNFVIQAGTLLWRVHQAEYRDMLFKTEPADPQFYAGRFDGMPPDCYPYCYAGLRNTTALMEKFLRSVPWNDRGERVLRRRHLAGHQLSRLEVLTDLPLVSLQTEADLAALRQDSWLLHAEGNDHAKTRRWAQWIRAGVPDAAVCARNAWKNG